MFKRLALAALILTTGTAFAQTWFEDGDAPPLLPGQVTLGSGSLLAINGSLSSGSDVDLYAIRITNAAAFSAATCNGAGFDSAIYLFDSPGNGVAMSEDGCGVQSAITSQFVAGTGLYYVAVTAYDFDPVNSGGLEIWNDAPWNLERAADGPGAPGPLADWGGSAGGSGGYTLYLTGAEFAQDGPPPLTGACCLPGGACQVMTPASCANAGGTYQGDETTCDPNPCPQPLVGACCFGTGGCVELTQLDCEDNGGSYLGDGSICWAGACGGSSAPATLFVGVQYGSLPTRTTDLSGFPNVGWQNGFEFELNGAAGRSDGALYLSDGDFNTQLYVAPPQGPAIHLCDLAQDVHALAYGRGRLFGFCPYASPMGIYEINPTNGDMWLLVANSTRRFFGLDYNPADGLLYGYDEYGSPGGLISINIDTGQMTPVASSVPAGNSAARGLACSRNKVYAVTVYGAEYPMYVYDLDQGPGAQWQPMTHPFPDSQATSGAGWAVAPIRGDLDRDGDVDLSDLAALLGHFGIGAGATYSQGDADQDGDVDLTDLAVVLSQFGTTSP